MYSTRTRVHARIPNGHPREEKRACRTKVRGEVGEDRRAYPARGKLNGPRARRGRPRRLPRAPDTRKSARKSMSMLVSVSVSVPWNLSLTRLGRHFYIRLKDGTNRQRGRQTNGRTPDRHFMLIAAIAASVITEILANYSLYK